jgi:hypothetical protein
MNGRPLAGHLSPLTRSVFLIAPSPSKLKKCGAIFSWDIEVVSEDLCHLLGRPSAA